MLDRDTQLLPSPLIGKPVPAFSMPELDLSENNSQTIKTITNSNFQGQKWVLNIWASWCAACKVEHPIFNEVANNTNWHLVGLNYKDQANDARQWLQEFKNPYTDIIYDVEGSLGLDLGVYGVPETYLIDAQGIIQYKHVGPICGKIIETVFMPFFANQPFDVHSTCADN